MSEWKKKKKEMIVFVKPEFARDEQEQEQEQKEEQEKQEEEEQEQEQEGTGEDCTASVVVVLSCSLVYCTAKIYNPSPFLDSIKPPFFIQQYFNFPRHFNILKFVCALPYLFWLSYSMP